MTVATIVNNLSSSLYFPFSNPRCGGAPIVKQKRKVLNTQGPTGRPSFFFYRGWVVARRIHPVRRLPIWPSRKTDGVRGHFPADRSRSFGHGFWLSSLQRPPRASGSRKGHDRGEKDDPRANEKGIQRPKQHNPPVRTRKK
jgi:hypothetical protein